MNAITCEFHRWEVECIPADGARLSALRFSGRDLLTQAPKHFEPPRQDFGEYETRPVYGYDDCFPSVEPCSVPDAGWTRIRDHGELCWLNWDVRHTEKGLDCRTRSDVLPAMRFRRSLLLGDTSVTWGFEVRNQSGSAIPFQHVMHPLMPLDQIVELRLPQYARVVDERERRALSLATPRDCADFVLSTPPGTATMLLLQGLRSGRVEAMLEGDLALGIEFSAEMFPTLGIWWNNGGYPDEDGCRRVECAFEPIPGPTSSLAEAYPDRGHLTVLPGGCTVWEITWNIRMT